MTAELEQKIVEQAAVIEKLRDVLVIYAKLHFEEAIAALAIPTDSTREALKGQP